MWNVTSDIRHLTHDMWHVKHDMLHMTCDRWWKVNNLSDFQDPSSYCLKVKVFWRYFGKWVTQFINQWMTKLFVEQPRLHQGFTKVMVLCHLSYYILFKLCNIVWPLYNTMIVSTQHVWSHQLSLVQSTLDLWPDRSLHILLTTTWSWSVIW